MDSPPNRKNSIVPGLCGDCQHARRMESDRGSIFLRCELAQTDNRFPKYPRLPVLVCAGYKKNTPENESDGN
jgi:hypothetical protein